MNKPFDGQVVVITGGARGIGYATAKRLISMGATVAIVLPTKNAPAQADQVSSVAGQSSSFAPSTAAWSAKLSLGSLTF
ncbi:SDR family NAD(P)-dependent oxidoreductase [Rhodococcus qingshengii]